MIKAYNTLSNSLEELILDRDVKFYLCGPTVYSFIHLGNARPLVFYDSVVRYLSLNHNLTFIQNFTDIDDKIIKKAEDEGVSIQDISDRYIEEYYRDANALNILKPNIIPKATEYVQEMIKYIERLLEKDIAYITEDGIYFDVSKFKEYGKLSKREVKGRESNFALWKFSNNSDYSWETSFGKGRPGWHIECSTMILNTVGSVDIHAGGQDLIFPHHENEIAQHECLNSTKLSKYWLHNSFIKFDDRKMSKSEGNLVRVRDLLKTYSGNEIRFFILSTHYRKPISFSEQLMKASAKGFSKLMNLLNTFYICEGDSDFKDEIQSLENNFKESMNLDFNTQGAMGAIFDSIKLFNKSNISHIGFHNFRESILALLSILGFDIEDRYDEEINNLVKKRLSFRKENNFVEADLVRDLLLKRGVEVNDGRRSSWKRV